MSLSLLSRHSLVFAVTLGLVAVACGGEPAPSNDTGANTADITAANGADKATSCVGTEPFWSVKIDAKTVQWEWDGQTRTIENKGPRAAVGMMGSYAALYQGKTSEDPNRFLNVIITDAGEGGCSDGMSDTVYPYTAHVLSGTDFHVGCCK